MRLITLTISAGILLWAADQPPSAAIFRSNSDLLADLQKSIQKTPQGMSTSAVANSDHYRINLVHRTVAAGAIAHPGFSELHYITEGSGNIVTGGTIMRPEGKPASAAVIENGVERHVVKGDTILIPGGMPHWYKTIDGAITYLEVRFEDPKK